MKRKKKKQTTKLKTRTNRRLPTMHSMRISFSTLGIYSRIQQNQVQGLVSLKFHSFFSSFPKSHRSRLSHCTIISTTTLYCDTATVLGASTLACGRHVPGTKTRTRATSRRTTSRRSRPTPTPRQPSRHRRSSKSKPEPPQGPRPAPSARRGRPRSSPRLVPQ